jgi:RNA polymerase sigma-70 factor, ECF subfamily
MLDERLSARLYDSSGAARWRVDRERFARALETSADKAFAGRPRTSREIDRFLSDLHLQDLALACACAAGDDEAWQHFINELRPQLYRAADALDPSGGARDLADSLYADLFGLKSSGGERQSLFRYFHGRSSLATWLRAVLSQRYVDRLRATRNIDALPDDDSAHAPQAPADPPNPERARFLDLMRAALALALSALVPKDRLRLACYYAQQMTLAQVGRLLGEHEATVSRQLARTRASIRAHVEKQLAVEHRLSAEQIAECFTAIAEDSGALDLQDMIGSAGAVEAPAIPPRKKLAVDRSTGGEL